jgi:hypothetical protein
MIHARNLIRRAQRSNKLTRRKTFNVQKRELTFAAPRA